jgi:hypothetical protein
MAVPWGRRTAVVGSTLLIAAVGATAPATAAEKGGNKQCGAGFTALKIDRAPVLGEVITDGRLTVTVTDVDRKVEESHELYGFAVEVTGAGTNPKGVMTFYAIVKGGPTAIAHNLGETDDLDTRLAPGGRHYGISNVTFCYKS